MATTVSWPAALTPGAADYGVEFDVQITAFRSGRIVTFGLPGARWVATITFANDSEDATRPLAEALIVSLRGGSRRLWMPHFGRPIPNGTLRGAPTLRDATTPGQSGLWLTNCNGGLKAGDILGVGGQLLMIEEDANPTGGAMPVLVSPAVRNSNGSGTPVVWNRPVATWIPKSALAGPFPYAPKYRPGFSVELVEAP